MTRQNRGDVMRVRLEDLVELILFVFPDRLTPIFSTTPLEDLIHDSLDYVEMAMEIQRRYDIPVDRLPHYEGASVSDFLAYINSTEGPAQLPLTRLAKINDHPDSPNPQELASKNSDIELF